MEMTNAMWEAAAVSAENWPAGVSISNWFYIVKGKRGKPDTAYGWPCAAAARVGGIDLRPRDADVDIGSTYIGRELAIGKEWVLGEILNSLHGAVENGSYTHDITVGKKKEVAAAFRAMKTK